MDYLKPKSFKQFLQDLEDDDKAPRYAYGQSGGHSYSQKEIYDYLTTPSSDDEYIEEEEDWPEFDEETAASLFGNLVYYREGGKKRDEDAVNEYFDYKYDEDLVSTCDLVGELQNCETKLKIARSEHARHLYQQRVMGIEARELMLNIAEIQASRVLSRPEPPLRKISAEASELMDIAYNQRFLSDYDFEQESLKEAAKIEEETYVERKLEPEFKLPSSGIAIPGLIKELSMTRAMKEEYISIASESRRLKEEAVAPLYEADHQMLPSDSVISTEDSLAMSSRVRAKSTIELETEMGQPISDTIISLDVCEDRDLDSDHLISETVDSEIRHEMKLKVEDLQYLEGEMTKEEIWSTERDKETITLSRVQRMSSQKRWRRAAARCDVVTSALPDYFSEPERDKGPMKRRIRSARKRKRKIKVDLSHPDHRKIAKALEKRELCSDLLKLAALPPDKRAEDPDPEVSISSLNSEDSNFESLNLDLRLQTAKFKGFFH